MRYVLDFVVIGDVGWIRQTTRTLRGWGMKKPYKRSMMTFVDAGGTRLTGTLRFINNADQAVMERAMLDLKGVFTDAEPGTKIVLHRCFHNMAREIQPCQVTVVYEVVEEVEDEESNHLQA